ncbi:low affinity iron permease family protein [Mucilaginibacter gotjawali]|uniref:Low affinity iron permease n=2 Tax=Mucilaginibacter gotjawali TaxID=1550579 RepID=A0A0X8X196_9SPHI|nr:low affinity iron permease family protein [Mucilaginibacter gotjawali]MBB3053702.1 low affinity Fe/Cu permease [Mucilaginibacter gotjawali]BAU53961.1 Low affinity iron permease [Mucilaginibacter gotjawali]
MSNQSNDDISGFEKISNTITTYSGSSPVFLAAIGFILLWAFSGPVFHFSNTWLLIVNTATSIITFLMVFLIQKSQNKESIAVQLKLNELIAANNGASNRLLNIQDLSEEQLNTLYEHYRTLVELTQKAKSNTQSHSVEDAIESAEEDIKNDFLRNEKK